MKCFACGGKMIPAKTDIDTGWGKYDVTIKGVNAYKCVECGYEVYDSKEVAMIQDISQAYSDSSVRPKPDILNVEEVADLFRVSTQTIYAMLKDGRLTARKVGREWRFSREEVERIVKPPSVCVAARSVEGKLTERDAAFIDKVTSK